MEAAKREKSCPSLRETARMKKTVATRSTPPSVSEDVMKRIMKLQTQTGHQSKRRPGLVRALAIAGAPEEAIRAAKKFELCHGR